MTDSLIISRQSLAPRTLPHSVAICLLLSPAVLFGSVLLVLGTIGFKYGIRASPVPAFLWLLVDHREAPGKLNAVTTEHEKGDPKTGARGREYYRFSYTFTLPNGNVHEGTSTSTHSFPHHAGANVVVEYHPKHVEANRIRGTSCERSDGWIVLVVVLPLAAIFFTGRGLIVARRQTRALKFGLLAHGAIVRCSETGRGSQSVIGIGDVTLKLPASRSTGEAMPLEEFQAAVWTTHRASVASQKTRIAYLRYGFAGFFGGLLSLIAANIAHFNGAPLWTAPLAAVIGSTVAVLVEWRFRLLERDFGRTAKDESPALPQAFSDVRCVISFRSQNEPASRSDPYEVIRILDLKGDVSDAGEIPLLYDPSRPSRVVLDREFSIRPMVLPDGSLQFHATRVIERVVFVCVAAISLPLIWLLI